MLVDGLCTDCMLCFWIVHIASLRNNSFPLLRPPKKYIIKTRVRLQFWKIEGGQFDFELIPFRQQFQHEATISGFHPLIIKTSQPRGVFY